MKAAAVIGTVLIVVGLGAFIAWQLNLISGIGGPPIQPPPPTYISIPVVFIQYHQLEGPTSVPDETFKVEETGITVTSGNSIDPTKCPTVQLGASYEVLLTLRRLKKFVNYRRFFAIPLVCSFCHSIVQEQVCRFFALRE